MIEIEFSVYNTNTLCEEELIVTEDNRHGKNGYRVTRYLSEDINNPDSQMAWDNQYMFYESLDEVMNAIHNNDYSKGKAQF
jgi:hypothetical protein